MLFGCRTVAENIIQQRIYIRRTVYQITSPTHTHIIDPPYDPSNIILAKPTISSTIIDQPYHPPAIIEKPKYLSTITDQPYHSPIHDCPTNLIARPLSLANHVSPVNYY